VGRALLLAGCAFSLAAGLLAQSPSSTPPAQARPAQPSKDKEAGDESQAESSRDWAAQLLDGILTAPNPDAADSLFRAAFAAGPSLVPLLAEALEDDRTAEYAAQAIAFIGGQEGLQVLWKLRQDKRDLNLRRFFYGALAEYDSDQATQTLFEVINKSDAEPDRTVTEAAILALTVRTDPKLPDLIRAAQKNLQDVVIRDDLENALDVIEIRSKYLASPEGRKAGGSVDAAVRTYFIPALQPPPEPEGHAAGHPAEPPPKVKLEIQNLTLSPDKMRALAAVTFEDPAAIANYDLVLQKRLGNWVVVSVWLGGESAKPEPPPLAKPPVRN
jgi:hypothetical protein